MIPSSVRYLSPNTLATLSLDAKNLPAPALITLYHKRSEYTLSPRFNVMLFLFPRHLKRRIACIKPFCGVLDWELFSI